MLRSHYVHRICLWILMMVLPVFGFAQTADTIRVVAYNLLGYPDPASSSAAAADTALRNPFYRTVVHAMSPDILMVCELNSQNGYNGFLQHVMNSNGNQYAAASYITSNDTERGLYYRSAAFQFIGNFPIKTALRDINQFVLKHIASGDTLRIFGLHLKASSGATNEQTRLAEVDSLRKVTNQLHAGSNFIVCGDFNLYGAFEPAYQRLLQVQSGNSGHVHDALSLSGTWNSASYAIHHTQSPRVRSFGGGATGGMDDRFDLILYSTALLQSGGMKAITSSLKAFGNDGLHYNDSINRLPNNAVGSVIANALHNASDHLPVLMDFEVQLPVTTFPDLSPEAVIVPSSPCPQSSATFQLQVRNTASVPIQFSTQALNIGLRIVSPGGLVTNLSRTLNAGTLAAGADTVVELPGVVNLTQPGNYPLKAWTAYPSGNDANTANDTLVPPALIILTPPAALTNPIGTLSTCQGSSLSLTASGGVSYTWSNGETSSTISVNTAGTYTVTVGDANGCTATAAPVTLNLIQAPPADTLFFETMGSVTSNTSIATHQSADGFENDQFFFSGSGDVRNTASSSGYAGASGGANVFLTNISGRQFQIDSISTAGFISIELTFSVYKNTTGTTGSDLTVQYSSDGINWNPVSFSALGSAASWYQRTSATELPAANRLLLRFTNTGAISQYRIDDVMLKGQRRPVVRRMTGTTLCNGSALTLETDPGDTYLWSNGATSSFINVNAPGTYTVTVGCITSEPFSLPPCAGTALQLNVLGEGIYAGNESLTPRLFNAGETQRIDLCDSVWVDLVQPVSPYNTVHSVQGIVKTDGQLVAEIPATFTGQLFYLVVRRIGWVSTWTKLPVQILPSGNVYSFGTP